MMNRQTNVIPEDKHRVAASGKILHPLEPGFYSDGHAFYVDMDEFLRTYGICDAPESRAVVWAEILDAFGEVPVHELGADNLNDLPRKRSALD